ncbi:unnamed protein product [Rotaria sp. Silwood1]|nr:unnamed protein product [Rotaria sp. Silwood1]CAF1687219.1 unnamed protein product [Rotaria sp. Silwood1]CAF3987299.1 unnamed protein product [Rotaria sp. Silwood1]
MIPLQFYPTQVFNETKHIVDVVAKAYLEKATGNVHHLVPVEVIADGNCLYNSIVLLMNDPSVTTSELRVRTIIELVKNENYYQNIYSQYVGPIDIAIKAMCKNYTYSELYEIVALCNVLQCNIQSVYPKIDFQHYMAIFNNVFKPVSPIIANCNIASLWSHALNEKDARETNNGTWSPNHFVPLMSPSIRNEFTNINQSTLIVVTPEKRTYKNKAVTQIRIPEFQSSPSKRLRSEENIENDTTQPITSSSIQKKTNDKEEKRQLLLEKKRQRSRSSRMNETEEQRQIRLQKKREQTRSSRMNEPEEQRQNRLQKLKERNISSRANETAEQRQTRLQKLKERSTSSRANETEEQRQNRLETLNERNKSSRANETEEQRQI